MHRFYLENEITGEYTYISGADQLHHLADVLRLKHGDQITVFDSTGQEFRCSIASITRRQAQIKVIERIALRLVKHKLTVACALPKKAGFDDIVDKLTQIGADTIIPLLTERVIVKEESQGARLERWRKIARSAAEQSQRNTLPSIRTILSLKALLFESSGYDLKLIPTLEGHRQSLPNVLEGKNPVSVLVLIGPEGDFTPQEVEQAISSGFQAITLGENVLKVETAALAAASYIKMAMD